jgi:hypothetical protein
MSRYQIRTPEEKALEDVLNEMASAAWDALCRQLSLSEVSDRDQENFDSALRSHLPALRIIQHLPG